MSADGTAALGANVYYYAVAVGPERGHLGVQFKFDATVAGTATIEDTAGDAAVNATTAGEWQPENPPDAYVATTGCTAVGAVVTIPGGTAGCFTMHLGNFGLDRIRLKVDLSGGTGGSARCLSTVKL